MKPLHRIFHNSLCEVIKYETRITQENVNIENSKTIVGFVRIQLT